MKGFVQSMHWLYENKEAAIDFLSKEMKLKPEYARRGWEYYTQNRIWHPDGDLNLNGMKYNLAILAEQGGAKAAVGPPAKYIDQSFINEAIKELKRK